MCHPRYFGGWWQVWALSPGSCHHFPGGESGPPPVGVGPCSFSLGHPHGGQSVFLSSRLWSLLGQCPMAQMTPTWFLSCLLHGRSWHCNEQLRGWISGFTTSDCGTLRQSTHQALVFSSINGAMLFQLGSWGSGEPYQQLYLKMLCALWRDTCYLSRVHIVKQNCFFIFKVWVFTQKVLLYVWLLSWLIYLSCWVKKKKKKVRHELPWKPPALPSQFWKLISFVILTFPKGQPRSSNIRVAALS